MGKRRKRLTMAKYAKKYASVKATIAKLKGEVVEALEDGVVAPVEEKKIEKAAQQVVESVKELQEEVLAKPELAPVVETIEEPKLEVAAKLAQTVEPKASRTTTTKKTTRKTTTMKKKASTRAPKATKQKTAQLLK